MKKRKIFGVSLLTVLLLSCGAHRGAKVVDPGEGEQAVAVGGDYGVGMRMPNAVVYKTNGNFNCNVAVTLRDGVLVSYPAPSDVSVASEPLPLADGWLLDRRGGVGENTAFLRWTYEEYAALPETPAPAEIRASVIPDAKVIAVCTLPFDVVKAQENLALTDSIVREISPVVVR